MYTQVEKTKENSFPTKRQESRAVANFVAQKKGNGKQGLGFVDNRHDNIVQRKWQKYANRNSQVNQFHRVQRNANERLKDKEAPVPKIDGHISLNKDVCKSFVGLSSVSSKSIQMVNMNATEDELTDNEDRETACDIFHNTLNSKVMQEEYGIQFIAGTLTITKYYNNTKLTLDQLLTDIWPQNYAAKPAIWKTAVREELKARFHVYDREYNGKSRKIGAIETSEDPDIEPEFNALRACVITALMYAEGGSVLGTNSVEELHRTLTTRFPASWGQYSDDNVIPFLYGYFSYESTAVVGKLPNAVATANYNAGMVSDGGHMVGFRKQGNDSYNFRDNESGETAAVVHPKRNKDAQTIWHK